MRRRDRAVENPEEIKRTSVFKIEIEEWSGKRKVEEESFKGAYLFEDVADIPEGWWRD